MLVIRCERECLFIEKSLSVACSRSKWQVAAFADFLGRITKRTTMPFLILGAYARDKKRIFDYFPRIGGGKKKIG